MVAMGETFKGLEVQFSSVTQSYLTLWDPMDCSTTGLPVYRQPLEFTQMHIHWVFDAIQPSHPLSSPSPTLNISQHQERQTQAFFCRAWRITWTGCKMSGIVRYFGHSLALPFSGIGVKSEIFQSCGHCWVFHFSWHIECSTFTTHMDRGAWRTIVHRVRKSQTWLKWQSTHAQPYLTLILLFTNLCL